MSKTQHPRIAVIADAHFHDPFADYGFPGIDVDGRRMTLRLLADSSRSLRVFNESYFALHRALDDFVADGVRHVVLLGDYSDDGQAATVESLASVLAGYERRFGMRFYATTGNHDVFGDIGRHRAKRFMNGDGSYSVVTSDPSVRDRGAQAIVDSDGMYCRGYVDGLAAMAAFGFFPRDDDLHWETPFGRDGNAAARMYEVASRSGDSTRRLMDASYLVEPFDGVWLLMIDANVFVPVDDVEPGTAGDLTDSTSAGWNAMLIHKRFILDWMHDVARRAKAGGKSLITFSHYPVIDPLDGTISDEMDLFAKTSMAERIPGEAVAEALIAAGIDLHFSGHLHVNDTARFENGTGFLANVSVPSLVAFPAAYKVLTVGDDEIDIETVEIDMPLDDGVMRAYEIEAGRTGLVAGGLRHATGYGQFLHEHIGHLVGRRHLKRDWPAGLAAFVRAASLRDIASLALAGHPISASQAEAAAQMLRADENVQRQLSVVFSGAADSSTADEISALDFLGDWYRLRMGSGLAMRWIGDRRLALYEQIGVMFCDRQWPSGCVQQQFCLIFRMLSAYRSGLASDCFRLDRIDGSIRDR